MSDECALGCVMMQELRYEMGIDIGRMDESMRDRRDDGVKTF